MSRPAGGFAVAGLAIAAALVVALVFVSAAHAPRINGDDATPLAQPGSVWRLHHQAASASGAELERRMEQLRADRRWDDPFMRAALELRVLDDRVRRGLPLQTDRLDRELLRLSPERARLFRALRDLMLRQPTAAWRLVDEFLGAQPFRREWVRETQAALAAGATDGAHNQRYLRHGDAWERQIELDLLGMIAPALLATAPDADARRTAVAIGFGCGHRPEWWVYQWRRRDGAQTRPDGP